MKRPLRTPHLNGAKRDEGGRLRWVVLLTLVFGRGRHFELPDPALNDFQLRVQADDGIRQVPEKKSREDNEEKANDSHRQ